jgi:hypothetical protein
MKKSDEFCLLTAVLAFTFTICAVQIGWAQTTKWVDQTGGSDANDGNTEATAYATLQFAIDNSTSGTAATQSIINVKDGDYQTPGQTIGGFATGVLVEDLNHLTLQAVAGHEPSATPLAGGGSSIGVENCSHVIIDNIDLDGSLSSFDRMHVRNSNDITLKNSTVEFGLDGIDVETDHTTFLIEKNVFRNLTADAVDFSDGAYSDITIQDNIFENNNRRPILIRNLGNAPIGDFIIRRNISFGTNSQEAFRVIGADNVLIENNVLMFSTQQGLYIDTNVSGGTPSSNITVLHNTFFKNGEEEIRTKVSGSDIIIKNNIIHPDGIHAAISANTSSLPGEDFNLVFNNGTSTESSQAAITTFGANTIIGSDPLFVSTTAGSEDLHLQSGSPAIAAGTDLGVTDDIEKKIRPNPSATDPDMGAYELRQPNNDPDCSRAVPSIATLWPPNHEFVPVTILGVTDPDGDPVTITITTIFQDEPVDGTGDGRSAPDGQGVGTATAEVRAERDGSSNGRVYHIGFTADDGIGGTCSGEVLVKVPKNQGEKGAAVDDGALFDSTISALSKASADNLASEFTLSAVYPNPFNPQTKIDYQLPKESRVVLRVFNIKGELVRTLADKLVRAGRYSVVWDGKDMTGAAVPSGTYFYQITAGDFVQTRTMVLLK